MKPFPLVPVPDKFQKGTKFFESFGGDFFVCIDSKWFKLDDGELKALPGEPGSKLAGEFSEEYFREAVEDSKLTAAFCREEEKAAA